MAGQVQLLRRKIRTVRSTKKITKAQELVATSRIAKAQERVAASRPYAEAITDVLTALASNANIDNPLLVPRENVRRAAVLLITSDRGLCGAYNANAIRTSEQLISRLRQDGKQVLLYIDTEEHHGPDGVPGFDELYMVHTQFRSLLTQTPEARIVAPLEVEETETTGPLPAYEFEPDADELLDALLPKYINTRIFAAMLDSAASESASRRRAMKSASDNADDLLKQYTRQMNSARQAAITQEISEIVGGADALAASGTDV